jgi:hypothetical protein
VEPRSFQIAKTELEKDGSSHVSVRLTWGDPPDKPLTWYVAAVVVRENGRSAVDDVLYERQGRESSLSKDLSPGCGCALGGWSSVTILASPTLIPQRCRSASRPYSKRLAALVLRPRYHAHSRRDWITQLISKGSALPISDHSS